MPVTPLHLGPALLAKAFLRTHFSLTTFALVQVIIDIESAINLSQNRSPVHAHLHTFLGSLVVASICALIGRPLGTFLNSRLLSLPPNISGVPARMRRALIPVTWSGAFVGAYFGALSHILLDGMMHSDLSPFLPWRRGNPFLLPNGFLSVHIACTLLLALGAPIAWFASRGRE